MLSNLPGDILIRILSQLHPRDIISIRKTCNTLSLISRQKTIWIDAVDQMCEQETLFRPSFSHSQTDMIDSSRLESIATGPMKWENLFTERRESPSQATSIAPTRKHSFSTSSVFKTKPKALFLVPGGRFLLARDNNVFAVFDLNSLAMDKPIATAHFRGQSLSFFTHPTHDVEKLQVVLFSIEEPAMGGSVKTRYFSDIYEISPQSNPIISSIGSFEFLGPPPEGSDEPATSLSYDTLALFYDDVLRLWKFKTDEWIVCRLDCPRVEEMILLGEDILLIHEESLSICNPFVYDCLSRSQALALPSQPNEGSDGLEYLCPRSERRFTTPRQVGRVGDIEQLTECLHQYFTASRPSTHFEKWVFNNESQDSNSLDGFSLAISTYCLEDAGPFSQQSLSDEPLEPIFISENKDRDVQSGPCIPCNNALYRIVYDKTGLYCQAIITRGKGTEQICRNITQDVPHQAFGCLASFCPASGRVCYQDMIDAGVNTKIHVLDFL